MASFCWGSCRRGWKTFTAPVPCSTCRGKLWNSTSSKFGWWFQFFETGTWNIHLEMVVPIGRFSIFGWFRISNTWWFHFFNVYPYLGKWSNATHIFQMGWNHQPANECSVNLVRDPNDSQPFLDEWPSGSKARCCAACFRGPVFGPPICCSMILFWSNYSDLTRPGPNGGLVMELPVFQGNLGWWSIIFWPDTPSCVVGCFLFGFT